VTKPKRYARVGCDSLGAPLTDAPDIVARTLREVIAPLVEADGGVLYFVRKPNGAVRLHLAGACAGCPGFRITSTEVIEPVLRAAGVKVDIEISAGWTVPEGAERVSTGSD